MGEVVLLIFATLFTALVATTTSVESRGNGPKLGNVGSVCACDSLLTCVLSGYALTRRRERVATGPQEG